MTERIVQLTDEIDLAERHMTSFLVLQERIVQLTDEIDLAERLHAERTRQAEQQQELVHSRRLREKATESLDCEPR